MKPERKCDQYRLSLHAKHPLHSQILSLAASLLVLPQTRRDSAVNAVMLHHYADTFKQLAQLPPEQLHQIAVRLGGAVEVHISLHAVQEALTHTLNCGQQRERHLQQCEWLIRHGASNHMILLLCHLLSAEDIRRMRRELAMPVNKGRQPALPMETRLSVIADWQATAGESDTFTRYRQLAERYPEYSMGQLFSTVTAAESGRV